MKMKTKAFILASVLAAGFGLAGWQADFDDAFAASRKGPVTLTFTYVSVYPASVVLHANYPGPAKPDKALWNSGDGWHSYTSKTIPLHSPVLRFRGDWRDSSGRLYSMFNGTFPSSAGMVRMTGGFDVSGAPAASMFYGTFYGDSGLTGSIPAGLFGDISGAPAAYMFYGTFNGCNKLTGSIPAGLFGDISGAPAPYMFRLTFYGDSGLTGSIPAGLFGAISGAPADSMFYGTFNGCNKLTGASATMPDGVTKLWEQFPTATGTQCDNCYLNASGLSDYATIPTAWK